MSERSPYQPPQSQIDNPRGWNNVEGYRNKFGFREVFAPAHRKIVTSVMNGNVAPHARIVEIGSGLGYLSGLVPPEYQTRYVQTDRSSEFAQEIKRMSPDSPVVIAEAYHLPFSDASQDAVLGFNIVDMISDTNRLMKEVTRVLKPGGKFVHFHDILPNSQWVAEHLPADVIPFPLVTDGVLDRFQLVDRKKYATTPKPSNMQLLLDSYSDSPWILDVLRANNPKIVDDISEAIQNIPSLEPVETPTFRESLTKFTTRACEASGLKVAPKKTAEDEAIISRSLAAQLSSNVMHVPVNVLQTGGQGNWKFIQDLDVSLPTDQILERSSLDVIVAKK